MSIRVPDYLHRNIQYDLFSAGPIDKNRAVRIANAVLPFFTLYKPLTYPLSLVMGVVRLVTTGKALKEQGSGQLLNTAVAVVAVAGTYFSHPLGMLIATGHDLLFDLTRLVQAVSAGEYQSSMSELLQAISDTLYIALFLSGGPGLLAASLSAQFLVGIRRSYAHFQKGGERLEGGSQLLMALIRGHQAIRVAQSICIEREMDKAKEVGRPYLPLANGVQKFLAHTGYRINGLARWTVRQISHLLLAPIPEERYCQQVASRVQTTVKVAFAIPLALFGFLLSTPCYLAASYVGTGRFEKIEAATSQLPPAGEKVKVAFQNICGQNPWSVLSGGVLPPLEAGPNGQTRADGIVSTILEASPDIYCGQEYDDWDTSEKIGRALAEKGYTCIRDLGCDDPILNHSGLFIATRSPTADAAFHPFQPEHVSGIANWCHRGVLETNISLAGKQSLKVVNIHLNPGGEKDQPARLLQLENYVAPLMAKGPALVVGDANLDTAALIADRAGLAGVVNALEGQVTCTDEGKHLLNGKPRGECSDCGEKIDVALYKPDLIAVSDIAIQAGNSDHHFISLTVRSST